jgi:hypothetical protein
VRESRGCAPTAIIIRIREKAATKRRCFAGLSNDFRPSTDDTKVTCAIARREKLDPLRREMPWVCANRRRTALLVDLGAYPAMIGSGSNSPRNTPAASG